MTLCPPSFDGRFGARRVAALAAVVLLAAGTVAGAQPAMGEAPRVSIAREQDAWAVSARFSVPYPASLVLEVLTDYEAIPRFMPDIERSVVLHQAGARTVVEQEAVSSVMMFSKRVHLRLAVERSGQGLRFQDELGTSFHRYVGRWDLSEANGHTVVDYGLSADPAFSVPGFLIRRLLSRDATEMIERLRGEMSRRATLR